MIRWEGGEPAKYKGVWQRRWGRWVSEIRLPNSRKRIWLGSYDSPEKAARAFDAAAFCLRGHGAALNFPDNPPRIVPRPGLTPQEIQAAAARHANEGAEAKEAAEAPTTEVGEGRPEFPSFDEFGDEYFAEQIPPPPPPSPPPGAESGAFYCTSESSFLWNFEEF